METLTSTQAQTLRVPICLKVAASFVDGTKIKERDACCVPPARVTVSYDDNEPVTGLALENFSIVNAEEAADLTHLFCVTAFAGLIDAGTYEIAMDGATWSGDAIENHCCVVQVTRVARWKHAIELGRTKCCIEARPIDPQVPFAFKVD